MSEPSIFVTQRFRPIVRFTGVEVAFYSPELSHMRRNQNREFAKRRARRARLAHGRQRR